MKVLKQSKLVYLTVCALLLLGQGVQAQNLVQVGSSTALQSANFGPLYRASATNSSNFSHYVYLYDSSELSLPLGAVITRIDWLAQEGTGGLSGSNIFNIFMDTTSRTSIAISGNNFNLESAEATAVYVDSNYQLPQGGGWISHILDHPFPYTGNNLKILTQHHKTGVASGSILFHYENHPGKSAGVSGSSNNSGTVFSPLRSNNRPNIRIHYLIPGTDVGVQSIMSPVAPVLAGASVPVTITGTNWGTVNITGASVGYSFNNGAPVIESWTGTLSGGSTMQHTFSTHINTPTFGATDLKVWITNPNGGGADLGTANDTLSKTICIPLAAGTYTVGGTNPDFATLAEAIDFLNCAGVAGPVQFVLASGTYAGSFSISHLAFGVSFFSATGLAQDVTITNHGNGTVFSIDATPDVVISGITFKRTNSSPLSVESAISVTNSDNFSLANCILMGPVGNPIGTPGSTSTNSHLLTVRNCNTTNIQNNKFMDGYYGINVPSGNISPFNGALNIVENEFLDIYHTPVLVQQKYVGVTIDRNVMRCNLSNADESGSIIKLADATAFTISNNKASGKTGAYFCDILVVGDSTENNIIYNNEFSLLTTTTSLSASPLYLKFSTAAAVQVLYNSFHLTPSNARGFGIVVWDVTGTGSKIAYKNNAFAFTFSNAPDPGDLAVIIWASPDTSYSLLMGDHNSYYSNYSIPHLSNALTGATILLASWQTQFGKDLNSITINPRFTGSNDLRPLPGSPLTAAGVPITSIAADIEGTARDAMHPSIGAYEIEPALQFDLYALELVSPAQANVANGSSQNIVFKFINDGYDTLRTASVHYQLNNGPIISESFTGLIPYHDTAIYTFSTPLIMPAVGAADFKVWSSSPNGQTDQNLNTDTLYRKFCLSIPGGIYTFGGPLTDFPDVDELCWQLSCAGVSGPVTFKAEFPGNVLEKRIVLSSILGVSAMNSVIFDGQGDTLFVDPSIYPTPAVGLNAIVFLDGVSYVTIQNFNIRMSGTNSREGYGIKLRNAHHNIIRNNKIDLRNAVTTNYRITGIIFSNTSEYTATKASYNIIDSNVLIGGGILLTGDTIGGENQNLGNQILNNEVSDFYSSGIYLSNTNGTVVDGNDIHRLNRIEVSSFAAIVIANTTRSSIIRNNRIHDSHAINSVGFANGTGISYVSTPPLEQKNSIYNNVIYRLGRVSEGEIAGMVISGSNADFYYNSVVMTYPLISGPRSWGIRLDGAVGIDFRYNNIVIDQDGTGDKFGIASDSSSVFQSDRNNIYANQYASGSQSVGGKYDYWNMLTGIYVNLTGYQTLTGWQVASGQDAASFSVNPDFINSMNGDYTPNHPALNNRAVPISYITTDFLGTPRHPQTPDIGAYEFCPVNGDSVTVGICTGTSYTFGNQSLSIAGLYTGLFINSLGCDSTVVLTLNVDTAILTNASATICQGNSYILGSQTLTTAGTYSHVFQSVGGCDSTVTLQLTVNPTHTRTASATICQGSSYVLGSQVLTAPGTYSHTFLNSFGCDSTVTLNLFVTPVDTAVTVNGLTLTANALNNFSYQWLNCTTGLPIQGEINRNYTVTANGSYALITTENGCTDTSACYTFLNVGVEQQAGLKALNLYPNPSQGIAYLSFELLKTGLVSIRVMDAQGREVLVQTITDVAGSIVVELPLEQLSEGIYSLLLETSEGRVVRKLVRTK